MEEEAITESIADAIQAKLAQSGERTFEYQVSAHYLPYSLATEVVPPPRLCSLAASLPQISAKEKSVRTKTARVAMLRLLPHHWVPLRPRKYSHSTKSARLVRIERST